MKTNFLLLIFAAAFMTASAQTPAGKATPTKNDLRKVMENTEWLSPKGGGQQERTFVFRKDGEMVDSNAGGGKFRHYTLETPDILKIYHGDPKKNRQAEFMFFRVNTAAMTAQQDTAASTIGGEMFLKFVGPAPKK